MLRRIISLALAISMTLAIFFTVGSVLFAPESLFEAFDSAWNSSLESALGRGNHSAESTERNDTFGDNYIVKFKSDVSEKTILDSLNGTSYRLIAESENRLFAVSTDDEAVFDKNSDIIEYFEPDVPRSTQAITNDPIRLPAHDTLGVSGAWNVAQGSSEVIVAVLDTGVNRDHEDLKNVKILSGFDAMRNTAGVNGDGVGHGTGVIGLIAATANNSVGIAGVASGVTVLPVKISDGEGDILSSDLISGIRFAADAGARIINLSVGGFSPSLSEQEAVNYAISKGCILISAAGNGGDMPYRDQKSYPASYDGVVSVASCDSQGNRSSFSQYNDAVDITAPGEDVTLLCISGGASDYRADSGTSYSCAFVSGIAALIASSIGKSARFTGAEFDSLIIETCGKSRTDSFGHGIINAEKMLLASKNPIITGVIDGNEYSESVTVGFNRGTATLDGEPIEDGETVVSNGRHTLTVTDGKFTKNVTFTLDYDPLYFDFHEFSSFAYFEFERGNATLDGFPYKSKDKISSTGVHRFVLVDGNERREKEFSLQYTLPTVYGVEHGKTYNGPVEILVIGDGSATLDGDTVYGETVVAERGNHALTLVSGNGAVKKTVEFRVEFDIESIDNWIYASAKTAFDEENGYFAVYNDSLVGISVFDTEKIDKYIHFLPIERVYGHAFVGEEVLFFGDGGVTVYDRNTLETDSVIPKKVVSPEGMRLFASDGESVFAFDSTTMYRLDLETEAIVPISPISFAPEYVFVSDGKILLTESETGAVSIRNTEGEEITSFSTHTKTAGDKYRFESNCFAVGNRLFDATTGELLLEVASDRIIRIDNKYVYTENRIIDRGDYVEIGSMPFALAEIHICENRVILFGREARIASVPNGPEGIARYGAAKRRTEIFGASETVNEFRGNIFFDRYQTVISSVSYDKKVAVIFDSKNSIYSFSESDLTSLAATPLRFSPAELSVSGGRLAVTFKDAPYVYVAPISDIGKGVYIASDAPADSACVSGNNLYFTSNGFLYSARISSGSATSTGISGDRIVTDGKNIFVLNGNGVSVYGMNLSPASSFASPNGHVAVGSKAVVVGSSAFLHGSYTTEIPLGSDALAIYGNTVVTEKSVFDLASKKAVGHLGVSSPDSAVITAGNRIFSFGDGIASVCAFSDGSALNFDPEVSGVEENGVYVESVRIDFKRGVAFLDGDPFVSGEVASGTGDHELNIVLPCGKNISIRFKIEAKLSGISFLSPSRTVSIGESVTLRVRFLPESASSVPVSYSCNSDGVSIDKNGRLTAHREGEYKVVATAVSDGRTFTAECTVRVQTTLISFAPDSGITVDRDRGFLLGVPVGSTLDTLKSKFRSANELRLFDRNGKEKSGYIGTGDRVVLLSDGTERDSLTAVVAGDTDGDGRITAYDIYILERVLKGHKFDDATVESCDVNRNGTVANRDLRELKNTVLGRDDLPVGEATEIPFGRGSVQTVSMIRQGDIIDVAVCITGAKHARAVSGMLNIGEGLTFVDGNSTGWKSEFYSFGDRIGFYAYGSDGNECGSAFKLLLNLRFRVEASAGNTVAITGDRFRIASNNGSATLKFEPIELTVSEPAVGDLRIDFYNAYDFTFNPAVHEYKATVSHNSALADIAVIAPEGHTVTVGSLLIPDKGSLGVVITHTDASGRIENFTIHVERDAPPTFDSNCKLSTLEVEGISLIPAFSPEIFNYNVSVPYGTQKLNIYAVVQNSTASIVMDDTTLKNGENIINISVGSLDGESLTYTLSVTVLPPEAPVSDDNDIMGIVLTMLLITALLSALALITWLIGRYDSKPTKE